MAETRAQLNRKVRQDALREQLEAQGHVQHVNDIAEKLRNLEEELEAIQVQRLHKAAELKLKLIDKYLPSLRQTELSADPDNPFQPFVIKNA